MATLVRLTELSETIAEDIFHRNNEVEIYRELEYSAAVKIQSWFRGARVRAYLKYLDINAIEIQRKWRGFLGRKKYRVKLKEQVCRMKLNYYNQVAVKIQKVWKGYFVRKYIFNYYSRKKYLKALEVKNELVRQELEDHAEQQEQERLWKEEALTKKKRDYQARKNHYLLSTEVTPGIYNSPFQPYPSEMEFHLRNARPLSRQKEKKICDQKARTETLPPLQARPQGPFREPSEVQKQRYKQFQPSLRVETSFTSVEEARDRMKKAEWVARINDKVFQPSTKKSYPYKPLLHTTSKYGHLDYGTKCYREEHVEKFILPRNFQSVVPPIPVFDKLNDTY